MGDVIRIGTETSGDPAYACQHMAAWWPLFKAIVKQDLNLDLEIIQALGGATASAGTHGPPGTALDLRSWKFTDTQNLAIVARARKYGAPATWLRTKAQGFDPHVHLVLDCPCTSPADYQITAVKQGYNGLGSGGRKGPDTHPKPDVWRTYAQGIALMEDDMALSTDDKNWIANQIAQVNPWKATYGSPDDTAGSRLSRILLAAEAAASNTRNISRGGNENSPIRQEIADANTNTAALLGLIKGLMAALDTITAGGLDLAAVEAAAKRGVEAGLAGASVVIDFPKEGQA